MSVLNKAVSYYPSILETNNGFVVNLQTILNSDRPMERILRIRQSDELAQKQLKLLLPCYTVAGVFANRCNQGLIESSGLAAVDLDSAEDYDVIYLSKEFKKIESIAYCGLSCRGKRLFCIVPLLYPDRYSEHYERLIMSFQDMGLPMGDDCHKIISQPRFVSWNDDNTQFFNHNAKPYSLLPKKVIYSLPGTSNSVADKTRRIPGNAFEWCYKQVSKSYSFESKQRHKFIVKLSRYCNIKGLSETETLDGCLTFVQEDFSKVEICKIVKHIYRNHSCSHGKLPFIDNLNKAN